MYFKDVESPKGVCAYEIYEHVACSPRYGKIEAILHKNTRSCRCLGLWGQCTFDRRYCLADGGYLGCFFAKKRGDRRLLKKIYITLRAPM